MDNIDIEKECRKEIFNLSDLQLLRSRANLSMMFAENYSEKKLFKILSDTADSLIWHKNCYEDKKE